MSTAIPRGEVVRLRPYSKFFLHNAVLVLLITALACGEDTTILTVQNVSNPQPTQVALAGGDGQQAAVGTPVPALLRIHAQDAAGNPVQAEIEWEFVDGLGRVPGSSQESDSLVVSTDANGLAEIHWVLGTGAGMQYANARLFAPSGPVTLASQSSGPATSSSNQEVSFSAQAVAGAAASVSVGSIGALLPGDTVRLSASASDAYGNLVSGAASWQSSDSQVASVDGSGLVTAVAPGNADVSVNIDGAIGSASIVVANVTPPPSITTSALPDVLEGSQYSEWLSASGGDGSYSWSLASGSLPSGLSLASSGLISGSSSVTGQSSFTVRVSSAGMSDTRALSINVSPIPNPAQYRQHLPAGWTVVSDYGMDVAPPPATQYFENQPFGDWRIQFWGNPAADVRQIQDPTSPLSPGPVLEEVYPPGLSGTSVSSWYRDIPTSDQVYISWVVKWDADFIHNTTSEKLIHFNLGSPDYFLFQFHWGDEAIMFIPSANPYYSGDGNLYADEAPYGRNSHTNRPIAGPVNGQWVEYELLFDRSTGTVKWWRDGVLHAHHTGRTFGQIGHLTIGTTWGGGGNKPGTHSRYTDHITVAVGN